jgi:CO/xanthine dehydrogenase FAD-binding subunit
MIATDFEYWRPATVGEATDIFARLRADEKRPAWYGGGTEILTDTRARQEGPGAVVDIKQIPETRVLEARSGRLVLGSALTLAEIAEANPWPLLTQAASRVADHTTRCKITLGGNLAGRIQYREAGLPFLLVDGARATVAGPEGIRETALDEVFDGVPHLRPEEFLLDVRVPLEACRLPGLSVKRTRLDWVDYPLVTVTLLKTPDGKVRAAFAGLTGQPFRSPAMDEALNGSGDALARAEAAVARIPGTVTDDLHGSAEYRRFVLTNTLADMLDTLGRK